MLTYKISEFADLAMVSPTMLRYYDQKGILCPEYKDKNTGYRFYTEDQLGRLTSIEFLRTLGFGASQIKGLIENNDLNSVYSAFIKRASEVDDRISELSKQRSEINSVLRGFDTLNGHPGFGVPFFKGINSRYLFQYEVDNPYDDPGLSRNYKRNICNMLHIMRGKGICRHGFVDVGSILPFVTASKGNLECRTMFSQVDSCFSHVQDVVFKPECVCLATLCENAAYEHQYVKMLYEECSKRELVPGECLREEIIFFPNLYNEQKECIYLLAVKVTL